MHVGRTHRDRRRPYTDVVLPDGCVDLIWDGGRVFVAGPDTGPVPVDVPAGTTFVGIRFRPGHAPAALGLPADAIRDQRPEVLELWGSRRATTLVEQLAAAPDTEHASQVLSDTVRERVRVHDRSDPLIDGLVRRLSSGDRSGPGVVAGLADDLGVSHRALHRRCTAAVGYGPKLLDRVLRMRRAFDSESSVTRLGLGAIAANAGYADHAHFSRECRRLTGRTPSELFKTGGHTGS